MTNYSVDVDELAAVVAAMSACQHDLVDLAADVEGSTRGLHDAWSGLAREAHAASHARWTAEFADMKAALLALREVADVARHNYTAAVETNVAMWAQLR